MQSKRERLGKDSHIQRGPHAAEILPPAVILNKRLIEEHIELLPDRGRFPGRHHGFPGYKLLHGNGSSPSRKRHIRNKNSHMIRTQKGKGVTPFPSRAGIYRLADYSFHFRMICSTVPSSISFCSCSLMAASSSSLPLARPKAKFSGSNPVEIISRPGIVFT